MKERDECAIRATSAGGWPEVEKKTLRPWSEGYLRSTSVGLKSAVERHCPNTTDRERYEGERQCGGDTDRRNVMRVVIAREPRYLSAALRALGYAGYRSGEREFKTLRGLSHLKKNLSRSANKLVPA